MPRLYILPDTNALMHFRRADNIDWLSLAGTDDVVILMTAVVIGEIDKHKNQHPIARLRDRARDLSAWLRQLRQSGAATQIVGRVQLDPREARSFPDPLDASSADDRLIARALELQAEGKSVVIATDDTILGLKLDAQGLREIALPDELRLIDQPSPAEAEAAKLRKRVAHLENRLPRLQLQLEDHTTGVVRLSVRPLSSDRVKSPDDIRAELPKLAKPESSAYDLAMGGFSIKRAEQYNNELDEFFQRYEKYYEDALISIDLYRRIFPLKFEMANAGKAVGSNVRVDVEFPDRIRVLDKRPNFPVEPKPPRRPVPGQYDFGLGGITDLYDPSPDLHRFAPIHQRRDAVIPVSEENRAVLKLDRLQHGSTWQFDELLCVLDEALIGSAARVSVTIACDELPDPIRQRFTFRAVVSAD
jgi:hypothetical protein